MSGCILSPCLFNFYAEYIMRNTGLEEGQAGIKIAGRNINNLRYADDTTFMAEIEEELKTKIMASVPITSWQIDGETMEIVRDFIFLGSEITEMVTETLKLKDTYSLEESYGQPRQRLKSRDVTLLTKVCLVKAIVFPVVMYDCEDCTVKKAER